MYIFFTCVNTIYEYIHQYIKIWIYVDDIKTWLNNTCILFHWAGSLRQSSSLTEVRWVVQWLHCWCHQSRGPIPGTWSSLDLKESTHTRRPRRTTLWEDTPRITCILQDGVGTPSRTLLTKIICARTPRPAETCPHTQEMETLLFPHKRGIKQRPQFAHTMPWQSPAATAYEMYVNQQTLGPSPRIRRRNCCRHSEGC